MIITIHQPDFMPWLGFFDRWEKSDLFVVLDDVQFLRRGWHHRDKIKTSNGIQWLTVPVNKKGLYDQQIKNVVISNHSNWKKKHLNTVSTAYSKAPNFQFIFNEYSKVLLSDYSLLIDLNMNLLYSFSKILEIKTPIIFSSHLNEHSTKTKRLVNIVKKCGGNTYLSGLGAKDYLDEELFENEGIKVIWQQFEHPQYSQLHGKFVEKLSIIDFLMMKSVPLVK